MASDVETLLIRMLSAADNQAVLLLDPEGTVTWASRGAQRILGPGRLEGQPLARFFPPEDAARGDATHELEVARSEGTSRDDRWQRRLDGSRFWASGSLYALRDESGTLLGFGKLFRNLTPQRELLELLRNQLSAQERAVATLAHELRSPLAALKTGLALARRGRDLPVDAMERQVVTLQRLVDDLMDRTRIATGKLALQLEPVVLQDVLESAAETVRPLAEQRGTPLHVLPHPSPVLVRGDATRLTQVFVNLLTNAVKFTPSGGEVRLVLTIEGDEALVRVEDQGIGIPPDMLARIFETFTQVGPDPKGGLGLGLPLVQELVTLHGGSVQVASEGEGKGSQFTVRLPLAEATDDVEQS